MDEKGFAFKTDMSPEMKEQIRQIVREEIAALMERPVTLQVCGEFVSGKSLSCLGDVG